ncbi:MAG: hypothetical protein QM645_10045 [Asticcacaulis sp.]
MRMRVSLGVILAGAIIALPAAAAEDPGLALVRKYVASWDIDAMLKEPKVVAGMNKLPANVRSKIMANLNVTPGVEYVGGYLRIEGNAPHAGGEQAAVLCIDPYGNMIHAGIYSNGAIQIYTTETRYDYVTTCVRDWVAVANTKFAIRMTKPASVQLVTVK